MRRDRHRYTTWWKWKAWAAICSCHASGKTTSDGGHGILFRTFEGQLTLALHAPNGGGKERARFIPVCEEDGRLVAGGP
jgi:hypothetical protein